MANCFRTLSVIAGAFSCFAFIGAMSPASAATYLATSAVGNGADAVFLGYLTGDELATAYSNADVLVFPSKLDTFGFTITEALATGTPVAAYPAPGPIDIITPNPNTTVSEYQPSALNRSTLGDSTIKAANKANTP